MMREMARQIDSRVPGERSETRDPASFNKPGSRLALAEARLAGTRVVRLP
jgi:hypothetical protein